MGPREGKRRRSQGACGFSAARGTGLYTKSIVYTVSKDQGTGVGGAARVAPTSLQPVHFERSLGHYLSRLGVPVTALGEALLVAAAQAAAGLGHAQLEALVPHRLRARGRQGEGSGVPGDGAQYSHRRAAADPRPRAAMRWATAGSRHGGTGAGSAGRHPPGRTRAGTLPSSLVGSASVITQHKCQRQRCNRARNRG